MEMIKNLLLALLLASILAFAVCEDVAAEPEGEDSAYSEGEPSGAPLILASSALVSLALSFIF